LDWFCPDAWVAEHNKGHHLNLNELSDITCIPVVSSSLREKSESSAVRSVLVAMTSVTWLWMYYSPMQVRGLHVMRLGAPAEDALRKPWFLHSIFTSVPRYVPRVIGRKWYSDFISDLFFRAYALNFFVCFVVVPVVVGSLRNSIVEGEVKTGFCVAVLANVVGSELIRSMHNFLTIATNHTGEDLWLIEIF